MKTLEVKNLKKYFGETKAVDGVSFDAEKSEILGFLGPNGAGKTTTIRCIMDFIRPDKGLIKIFEEDISKYSCQSRQDMGFLPEENIFYEDWSGQEHIEFLKTIRSQGDNRESPKELYETYSKEAERLIQKLDFDPSKKVKELSTGNQRKLGIILSLLHNPRLVILDEPISGLDPLLKNKVYTLLEEKAKNGTTIFMSSHNLAAVEQICHRVCIIREGKVVALENIPDLKDKKIYSIQVYFNDEKSKKTLISDSNVEITKELPQGLILKAKGDINPLLSKLNSLNIKDVEIHHSDLEEIFLEYYQ